MKDAGGHGSNERGGVATHASAIHALPGVGAMQAAHNSQVEAGRSDASYRAAMPIENFTGGVQDLLGLWDGTQKPSPLSDGEKKQINDAYAQRANFRVLAGQIQDQRRRAAH